MIESIKKFWDERGLEFLLGISVLVIIICFFVNYCSGEKGTYTLPNFINNSDEYKDSETDFQEEDTGFTSKLESKSKIILENIFNRPFARVRPDFLENPVTGNNLELDLYNKDLKLAIEVQGDQHYKFTPFFQKNKEAFLNQRYRDEIKKIYCKQNGITLIEIPYKVGEKKLKNYIVQQLRLEGYLL